VHRIYYATSQRKKNKKSECKIPSRENLRAAMRDRKQCAAHRKQKGRDISPNNSATLASVFHHTSKRLEARFCMRRGVPNQRTGYISRPGQARDTAYATKGTVAYPIVATAPPKPIPGIVNMETVRGRVDTFDISNETHPPHQGIGRTSTFDPQRSLGFLVGEASHPGQ
jgi:hypothetical protein